MAVRTRQTLILALNSATKPVYRSSGQSGFAADVSDDPAHVVARKLESEVRVCFATTNATVKTAEGVVHAKPGDALITGPGGENWRVSRAHFAGKYRPVPPTTLGQSGTYISLPYRILAVHMPAAFDVWLADGLSCLHGRPGDWLTDYGDGSLGVVAESIFAKTYEVLT